MGKIKIMSEEEYEKYASMMLSITLQLEGEIGIFFLYNDNGEDKLMCRQDNLFTIVDGFDKDNVLKARQFIIGEDYKLICAALDNKTYYDVNGVDYLVDDNTLIQEQVDFLNRDFEADKNGIIAYLQYDEQADRRAIITYNQYKSTRDGEKGFIFGSYLGNPDTITIQSNVHGKKPKKVSYIKQEIDNDQNPGYFNVISVKEYGINDVLSKGAVSLQKSSKISRYFKMVGQYSDGTAITGFPFCNVYSCDDMYKMLLKYGFKSKIPTDVVDFYNGKHEDFNYIQQIVEEIKRADLEGLFSLDAEDLSK